MDVDRALTRSRQAVNILWSAFLLALAVYVVYWATSEFKKKSRRKKESLRLRNHLSTGTERSKKRNKGEQDEETTMMVYPNYELANPARSFHKGDAGQVTAEDSDSYGYKDLLALVNKEDETFFGEYLEAVKNGLQYKRERYSKILKKKYLERDNGESNTIGKAVNDFSSDPCVPLEKILTEIERQLTSLTVKDIKKNFQTMLFHKEKGLESLVERVNIQELVARQIFAYKNKQKRFFSSHQNALILGPSGVGKSRVGECLAHAFGLAGITVYKDAICIGKERVVSPYIEATGPISRSFLESHLEHIIIVEEIYSITPEKDMLGDEKKSHGRDFIDFFLKFSDEYKGLLRVYGIGYEEDTMERFIKPNQGMERRFRIIIRLLRYSTSGLTHILIRFLLNNGELIINDNEAQVVHDMIEGAKSIKKDIFDKEAGDMENMADEILEIVASDRNGGWRKGSKDKDADYNIHLLQRGINKFLYNKGRITLAE